jgi:hypothetical protein
MMEHTTEAVLDRIDDPDASPDIRILAVANEIQALVNEGALANLEWGAAGRLQGLPLILQSVAADIRLAATPRPGLLARTLQRLGIRRHRHTV